MKYIISENRLSGLFTQFMNKYDLQSVGPRRRGLSVYNEDNKKIFYTVYYGDDPDTGKPEFSLKINSDFFFNTLYSFFGDTLDPWMLVDWFSNKFKMDCVTFDYFEPEYEDE